MPKISVLNIGGDIYALIEQFDHVSEDQKTLTTYEVTRMLLDIEMGKLPFKKVLAAVDPDFAVKWLPQRDVNLDYAMKLSPKQVALPLLGVERADGTTLLIDGSHRYLAAYIRGLPELPWYIVEAPHWHPYASVKENLP